MTRYTDWASISTDQGNIVGSRMANEIEHRFGGVLRGFSKDDQRDAAVAEMLAGTPEVLNIKSFGAKVDGATDDTAAIQAALDAATSGETVWVPRGTGESIFTSTLTVNNSNTTIDGPGTLKMTTLNTTGITFKTGVTGIVFSVYKLIGNATTASTNKWGIQLPDGSFITGSWLDTWHAGVQVLGSDVRVIGNRVTDSPGSAPGQGYGILTVGARTVVNGNVVTGVGRHALYFSSDATWGGSSGGTASGNTLEVDAPQQGGCSIIKVKSIFGHNDTVGVQLSGNSCKITGTPVASAAIGIEFSGDAKYCVASGNYVEGTNSSALKFIGHTEGGGDVAPDNCLFIGNTVNATSGFLCRAEKSGTAIPVDSHFMGTVSDVTDFAFPASAIDVTDEAPSCTVQSLGFRRTFTLSNGDSSPDAQLGDILITANTSPATITDFDFGYTGQRLILRIADANTTIDFTSSGLKGNGGVDWSPVSGDHMTCVYDGTDWFCDISENILAAATVLDSTATPSVAGGELFKTVAAGTNITDFDDGVVGQTISIEAADSIDIAHGASTIRLVGAATYSMTVTDTLVLKMWTDGIWTEVSRSVI